MSDEITTLPPRLAASTQRPLTSLDPGGRYSVLEANSAPEASITPSKQDLFAGQNDAAGDKKVLWPFTSDIWEVTVALVGNISMPSTS